MNEERTGFFMTSGRYPWSFVTQIFYNGHGGDRNTSEVILQLNQYEPFVL
jgi:hypothetical protein